MKLSQEQINAILKNAPVGSDHKKIVSGLVLKGYDIDGVDPVETENFRSETRTKQLQQEAQIEGEPTGVDKFAKGTEAVIGGGVLAQGLGESIASRGQTKEAEAQLATTQAQQSDLLSRLKEAQAQGDTERIERLRKALGFSQEDLARVSATQEAQAEALPTDKEVEASMLRLMGTAVAGKAGQATLKPITGVASGLKTGAVSGASAGAAEGFFRGQANLAEDDSKGFGTTVASTLGGAVGGAVLGGAIGGIGGGFIGRKLRKAQLRNIAEVTPDARSARYTLEGQKLVKDKDAVKAINAGIDEADVALIKGASEADKQTMKEMTELANKASLDRKITDRPIDIVGDKVMNRFNVVAKANKEAANQLDNVAKGLKGQVSDFTPALSQFEDTLEGIGVNVVRDGKGKVVLDFAGSDFEGIPQAENLIKNIYQRSQSIGDDAFEAHRLKRFIDNQVQYGKQSEGLVGNSEALVKQFRRNLDQILDGNFTDYNAVNTKFSETRKILDEFGDIAGRKFDPNSPTADIKAGLLMRRILSNSQSRGDVAVTVQNMQNAAESLGGKFDDDLITLLRYTDTLEDVFGTQATTSLRGQVTGAIKDTTGLFSKLKSGKFTEAAGDVIGKVLPKEKTPQEALSSLLGL